MGAACLGGSIARADENNEQGILPFANLTLEGWGNVAGGLERRGWVNSLLDFGLELDTAKLGWWQGGRFMVQGHWVQNLKDDVCFSDYTGAFNPVSSIEAGNHLRVFNLHYTHSWKDDAVLVKVGQLAADDDFMGSDYAGLFINSAFGAMPSQVGTPSATSCGNVSPFPIYSVAAPGVFVRVQPLEGVYSQLGLYYGRPGLDEEDNYGFDWAGESHAALGLFWESGYAYKLVGKPSVSRLGLSYHTGLLDDFSGDFKDVPPATRQAVPNFYAIQDVQVLSKAGGEARLGWFARGGITPEPNKSMVAWYADSGLNWFEPLPGRENDVAGIAISHTSFGRHFRHATGPEGVSSRGETALEITYQAGITRWMTLQADLQFLFNPAPNPDSGSRETATVIGLRANFSL